MAGKDVFTLYFSAELEGMKGPVDKAGALKQIKQMGLNPEGQSGIVGEIIQADFLRPATLKEQISRVRSGHIVAVSTDDSERKPKAFGGIFPVATFRGIPDYDGTRGFVQLGDKEDPVALSASIFVKRNPPGANLIVHSPVRSDGVITVEVAIPDTQRVFAAGVTVYTAGSQRQFSSVALGATVRTDAVPSPAGAPCNITSVGLRIENDVPIADVSVTQPRTGRVTVVPFPLTFKQST